MLAIAVLAGLLVGASLGALGGGGSILTVPALVYLLGQSTHSATTGSLLVVGITALAGVAAHLRAGRVRVSEGLTFGLLGIAGSFVGSHLSARADPDVLLTSFAALMLVAAAAMVHRLRGGVGGAESSGGQQPDADRTATEPGEASGGRALPVALATRIAPACPGTTRAECAKRLLRVLAAATVVGLLTGFFGVGGGFVIVPALVLALGFDMPVAVGTSLLVIAINSAAALVARLGAHAALDWPMLGTFTAAAIVGSLLGSRVAHRADPRRLTQAFVVLLVGVAVYVAARSIPGLV